MALPDACFTAAQLRTVADEISSGRVVRSVVIHPYSGVATASDSWSRNLSARDHFMVEPDGIKSMDSADPAVYDEYSRQRMEQFAADRRLEDEVSP